MLFPIDLFPFVATHLSFSLAGGVRFFGCFQFICLTYGNSFVSAPAGGVQRCGCVQFICLRLWQFICLRSVGGVRLRMYNFRGCQNVCEHLLVFSARGRLIVRSCTPIASPQTVYLHDCGPKKCNWFTISLSGKSRIESEVF